MQSTSVSTSGTGGAPSTSSPSMRGPESSLAVAGNASKHMVSGDNLSAIEKAQMQHMKQQQQLQQHIANIGQALQGGGAFTWTAKPGGGSSASPSANASSPGKSQVRPSFVLQQQV